MNGTFSYTLAYLVPFVTLSKHFEWFNKTYQFGNVLQTMGDQDNYESHNIKLKISGKWMTEKWIIYLLREPCAEQLTSQRNHLFSDQHQYVCLRDQKQLYWQHVSINWKQIRKQIIDYLSHQLSRSSTRAFARGPGVTSKYCTMSL